MIDPIEKKSSGYFFFGNDVFTIPCFRDSFLYGMSAATGSSFLTFLLTSNGMKSLNIAFGALIFTAFPYMIYCQEKHYDTLRRLKEVEDLVKNKTNSDFTISDNLPVEDFRPDAIV